MEKKITKKNQGRKVIGLLVFISIMLVLILEFSILFVGNKRNAENTSTFLLNQVIRILEEGRRNNESYYEDLKQEYIVRAKAISYLLERNPEDEENVKELMRIADLMGVDEINLFNKDGMIYSGTIPKYFGMTMNDGEQIGYFLPMLKNKSMVLCQDLIPNTAENKNTMYAMVWKEDGSGLVQIGIEPFRFLEALKHTEIVNIISELPVYNGIQIIVAEKSIQQIIVSTNSNHIGKKLEEIGILKPPANLYEESTFVANIDNRRSYCLFVEMDEFFIGITQEIRVVNKDIPRTLIVVFIILLIVSVVITIVLKFMNKLLQEQKDAQLELQEKSVTSLKNQLSVIQGISRETTDIMLVNAETLQASMLKENGKMNNYEDVLRDEGLPYSKVWDDFIRERVLSDDSELLRVMVKPANIKRNLEDKDEFITIFRENRNGKISNIQVRFTKFSDVENRVNLYIVAFRNIDDLLEEQHNMNMLEEAAKTDKLTGLLNRRAYEDFLAQYPESPKQDNFVFIALDVNGLKQINDTLGHSAGDELLLGASACIKRCFGSYGKVYRTGGDEFVALIYVDKPKLEFLCNDFVQQTQMWKGKIIEGVSVSIGYAHKLDYQTADMKTLSQIADKRMYEAKALFYENKGFDRRARQDAYDSIANFYTKILKVNLTKDSYQIIKILDEEKISDKGFEEKISLWLKKFATSGHVMEEDLEEYLKYTSIDFLREYFKQGNSRFYIMYNRKIENDFKKVILEMIPAKNYRNDNQEVFLYVKQL